MHCYEYLVMHMFLKAELKRLYPDHSCNQFEIEEVLSGLGVNGMQELQEKKSHINLHYLNVATPQYSQQCQSL